MEIKHSKRGTPYMETGNYQVTYYDKIEKVSVCSLRKNGKGKSFPSHVWDDFKTCLDAKEFNYLARHLLASH